MTSPWVPGETINAGKMFDRVTAPLEVLKDLDDVAQLQRNTAFNLASGANAISAGYGQTVSSDDITLSSSGVLVVNRAGVYRWSASLTVPAGAATVRVTLGVLVNGTLSSIGQNDVILNTSFAQARSTSGEIGCDAGTTFQLYLGASAAVTGVTIPAFTLSAVA